MIGELHLIFLTVITVTILDYQRRLFDISVKLNFEQNIHYSRNVGYLSTKDSIILCRRFNISNTVIVDNIVDDYRNLEIWKEIESK